MAHLCILVQQPLLFTKLDDGLIDVITVQGNVYKRRLTSNDDIVFYDWIVDEMDIVRALEVHLSSDHALLQSSIPLNSISQIESDFFIRIWFSEIRVGVPQGKEAFGDIFFLVSDQNMLAIVVGFDWLDPSQEKSLLASLDVGKT